MPQKINDFIFPHLCQKSSFILAVSLSDTHTHTHTHTHCTLLKLHRFFRLIGCRHQPKADSCFLKQLSQQLLTVISVHLHTPSSPQTTVFISYHQDKQVTHESKRAVWSGEAKWCRNCSLTVTACFISAVTYSPNGPMGTPAVTLVLMASVLHYGWRCSGAAHVLTWSFQSGKSSDPPVKSSVIWGRHRHKLVGLKVKIGSVMTGHLLCIYRIPATTRKKITFQIRKKKQLFLISSNYKSKGPLTVFLPFSSSSLLFIQTLEFYLDFV